MKKRKRKGLWLRLLHWMIYPLCVILIILTAKLLSGTGLLETTATETAEVSAVTSTEASQTAANDSFVQSDDWRLILVNASLPIPENYEIELTTLSNGQQVDSRIYPSLQQMFDDMRAADIYPTVAAGYRTAEKQQSLMDERIAEYVAAGYSEEDAKAEAENWVAVPGTSEHQLGIAVDINADPNLSTADDVYNWLAENAHLYGFIQRYPSDKTDITGISNEPWHYRYVGVEAATEIYEQGLCLEEYLGWIQK